jgi:hypothetical protein
MTHLNVLHSPSEESKPARRKKAKTARKKVTDFPLWVHAKASRGGDAAAIRNRVPEALPLSDPETHFSEFSGFRPSSAPCRDIGVAIITWEESAGELSVFFAGIQGFPHGQVPAKRVFLLALRRVGPD